MAKKRRKPTKSRKSNTKKQVSGNRQRNATILFGVAILLLFVVLIEGATAWKAIHNVMFGLFGFCAYLIPILLGYIAIVMSIKKEERIALKISGASCLVVVLNTAIVTFANTIAENQGFGEYIKQTYSGSLSGGAVGGLLSYPLQLAVGSTCARIIICILIFVLLMLVTGTSLGQLIAFISYPFKKIKQKREEREEEEEPTEELPKSKKPKFNVDLPLDEVDEPEEDSETLEEKRQKMLNIWNEVAAKHNENAAPVPEEEKPPRTRKPREKKEDPEITTGVTIESAQENVYQYPPVTLLKSGNGISQGSQRQQQATAQLLVDTLRSFGVETRLLEVSRGPSATRYELQPAAGVKISKITGLADDIALSLAAPSVRIEAPIPGKAAVGIEVPNSKNDIVTLRDLLETPQFTDGKSKLTAALGRDISGNNIVVDIAKMPHLLVAGTTGSGKSVCTKSMIMSILYKASPEEVKFVMIDPKQVELTMFNGIPHLLVPVVSDPRKASGALGWAVTEMERRYKILHDSGASNLENYNKTAAKSDNMQVLPQIVIVIDELADLMMTSPKEVEDHICRLAQKARAAGMHLIIATQRPEAKVITGLIKANIPSRIGLHTANALDSRIILDQSGAEKLLGHGDMLYSPVGSFKPLRVQGCFVDDPEMKAVVEFIKANAQGANYDDAVSAEIEKQAAKEKGSSSEDSTPNTSGGDSRLDEAIEVVVECGSASTSLLQRRLKLGYAHAARIVDEMEARGIVGPFQGAKPREVLITKEQWLEMKAAGEE